MPPLTRIEENEHGIYLLATQCDHLFKKLLSKRPTGDDRQHRTILEYYQRFELWAGFLGVFAEPQAALDSRLRHNDDLRSLILQLLAMLQTHLQPDLYIKPRQDEGTNIPVLISLATPPHNDDRNSTTVTPVAKASLDALNGALDRLQRLAVAIRRASANDITSRVNRYARKSDDDDRFFERLSLLMIHGLFREINESLAKQLAYTVCFRRLRFLYQRRHQQKLENRRRTYNTPDQVTSLPRQNSLVYRTQSEVLHRLPQNHPEVSPASWDGLSRTDHSTLDPTKFQGDMPETRSVASGTTIISSIGQDYKYPPPPKPKELAESCSCPWCFEELKASQLATPGWWRSHFNKDLEPYVCISEDCMEPPVYFTSLTAWIKHMKSSHTNEWAQEIHKSKVWYCDLGLCEFKEYSSMEALDNHIQSDHNSNLTDRQRALKLRRNVLSVPRDQHVCPLCQLDITSLNPTLPDMNVDDYEVVESKASTSRKVKVRINLPEEHQASDEDSSLDNEDLVVDEGAEVKDDTKKKLHLQLTKHIAKHLKALSFISIRYFDDESASTNSERASHGNQGDGSELEQSNTSLSDLESSLSFEDISPDQREIDTSSKLCLEKTKAAIVAFSTILASIEFYVEGISVTKRYWKYREEMNQMLHEIRADHTLFTNNCHMILIGVISSTDMTDFLTLAMGTFKSTPEQRGKFRERLGRSLDTYLELIQEMVTILDELSQQLKLDEKYKPRFSTQTHFKQQYQRLKFSLKKADYAKLLSRLKNCNSTLYKMTVSITKLENTNREAIRIYPNFKSVQDHAKALHSAIRHEFSRDATITSVHFQLNSRGLKTDGKNEHGEYDLLGKAPFRLIFGSSLVNLSSQTLHVQQSSWMGVAMEGQITESMSSSSNTAESAQNLDVSLASAKRKKVVFAAQDLDVSLASETRKKVVFDPSTSSTEIFNLCKFLSDLPSQVDKPCTGYISGSSGQRYTMYIAKGLEHWTSVSLTDALLQTSFTRRMRYRCAITIASGVIQLSNTPWLSGDWTKEDIVLIHRLATPSYEDVFVTSDLSNTRKDPPATHSSMDRIIRNKSLYTLGIILIELCYGKTIQQLHIEEDGAIETNHGMMNAMTTWSTVERLNEELYSEAGEKYAEVVRRCIRCDFDHRSPDLKDDTFIRAVYDKVVRPLQQNFDYMYS